MKLGSVNIETNDDGTYQVNCSFVKNSGRWCEDGPFRYSAKSLDDVLSKIKDAQKKISGLDEKSKKKNSNRSVEDFIKT